VPLGTARSGNKEPPTSQGGVFFPCFCSFWPDVISFFLRKVPRLCAVTALQAKQMPVRLFFFAVVLSPQKVEATSPFFSRPEGLFALSRTERFPKHARAPSPRPVHVRKPSVSFLLLEVPSVFSAKVAHFYPRGLPEGRSSFSCQRAQWVLCKIQ